MRSTRRLISYVVAAFATLSACDGTDTFVGNSNDANYLAARNALETGQYSIAIKKYQRLLASLDGRPAARVQLEYIHALLRANQFEAAGASAAQLTNSREPSIRAGAIAVRGTARHEQARAKMAAGQVDAGVRTLLTSARDDLTDFLRNYKKWDEAGAMQSRLKLLEQDMSRI